LITDISIIYKKRHIYNIPPYNQIIYQILNKFVIFNVFEQIYSKDLKSRYGSVKNNLIDPYTSLEKKISDKEEWLNQTRKTAFGSESVAAIGASLKYSEEKLSKYQKDYDIYDKLSSFLSNTIRDILKELKPLNRPEMKEFINKLINLSDYSQVEKQQIKNYFNPQSIGGKKKIYNRR